jgi:5-methylcytosine-specific restriction endonuclease McrA
MKFDVEQRRLIYDRTSGYCHICHKKLSFVNYGCGGEKGAWEVEHSRPQAKGGTHHGNNLYPACIKCNRDKSHHTTSTARRWNGTTRAPLSKLKKRQIREDNANICTVIGGVVGIMGGPIGIAAGAFVGRQIGKNIALPKI